jgi:hypothetical protein
MVGPRFIGKYLGAGLAAFFDKIRKRLRHVNCLFFFFLHELSMPIRDLFLTY